MTEDLRTGTPVKAQGAASFGSIQVQETVQKATLTVIAANFRPSARQLVGSTQV